MKMQNTSVDSERIDQKNVENIRVIRVEVMSTRKTVEKKKYLWTSDFNICKHLEITLCKYDQ